MFLRWYVCFPSPVMAEKRWVTSGLALDGITQVYINLAITTSAGSTKRFKSLRPTPLLPTSNLQTIPWACFLVLSICKGRTEKHSRWGRLQGGQQGVGTSIRWLWMRTWKSWVSVLHAAHVLAYIDRTLPQMCHYTADQRHISSSHLWSLQN